MGSAVPAATVEIRVVYTPVMGLTGAGKSTFVSVVTENDGIPMAQDEDMDGVTQDF
ncbi:hypothetical protein ABVK25_003149 [Lepraria finkii]|uniref:Uncharacterized protein n=1 Tax=Lepraria finkii TaxID=1340010 RepID=A0ABR4BG19_9LECA